MKKMLGKASIILVIIGIIITILYQKSIRKPLLIKIAGISILTVNSGSMAPTIQVGDAILIKEQQQYHVGDIITYREKEKYLVTHRIIQKKQTGYETKGDHNSSKDEEEIKHNQIEGKVILTSPILGFIIRHHFAVIILLIAIIVVL